MKLRIPARSDNRRRATSDIQRYWYTLLALTGREIRKRYARTLLGSLWAVLVPLAMLGIYLTVFGFILRAGQTQAEAWDYAFSMLAGLMPYQALTDGLHRACTSLREDRSLLEREQFPAGVLPAARVLSASVAELVGMVLLCLAAAFHGKHTGVLIVALPAAILLRILFTLGLAWMLSTLSIFISDVGEILGFVTTAWLFLTPIVYRPASMPQPLAWTLAFNPLHYLVELYRGIVVQGHVEPSLPLIVAMWAFISACLGAWFFRQSLERVKDFL